MEIFEQTWAWLGREIIEFGIRWLVVGVVIFGVIKWLKERDLRRIRTEIAKARAELKREEEDARPEANNWSLDGRAITYRTVRGELKVRYDSVHSAHKDIDKWLKEKSLYSHSSKFIYRISDDHEYDPKKRNND